MSKAAIAIIREFIASADAKQRGNAAVALAAVGGSDALHLLLDLSTRERDPEVRRRAVAEIAALPPDKVAVIKELILEDLAKPGDQTQTFAIAADLVSAGRASFSTLSPWKSLVLTYRAAGFESNGKRFKSILFSTLLMAAGVASGWILLAILILMTKTNFYDNPGYSPTDGPVSFQLLIGLLLGVLLGVSNIRWKAQARVGWAALLELIFSCGILLLLCTAAIGLLSLNNNSGDWLPVIGRYMKFAVAAMIFTRIASLGLLIGMKQTSRLLRVVRFVVVLCSGFAVLLGLATTWVEFPVRGFGDTYYSCIFVITIPLLLGLVLVFEFRDWSYCAPLYPFGRIARWLFLVVPIFFVFWLGYRLVDSKMHPEPLSGAIVSQIDARPGSLKELSVDPRSPFTVKFVDNTKITLSTYGSYGYASFFKGKPLPGSRNDAGNSTTCYAKKNDIWTIQIFPTPNSQTLFSRIGNWLGYQQLTPVILSVALDSLNSVDTLQMETCTR
jgi:hypothetical protein